MQPTLPPQFLSGGGKGRGTSTRRKTRVSKRWIVLINVDEQQPDTNHHPLATSPEKWKYRVEGEERASPPSRYVEVARQGVEKFIGRLHARIEIIFRARVRARLEILYHPFVFKDSEGSLPCNPALKISSSNRGGCKYNSYSICLSLPPPPPPPFFNTKVRISLQCYDERLRLPRSHLLVYRMDLVIRKRLRSSLNIFYSFSLLSGDDKNILRLSKIFIIVEFIFWSIIFSSIKNFSICSNLLQLVKNIPHRCQYSPTKGSIASSSRYDEK